MISWLSSKVYGTSIFPLVVIATLNVSWRATPRHSALLSAGISSAILAIIFWLKSRHPPNNHSIRNGSKRNAYTIGIVLSLANLLYWASGGSRPAQLSWTLLPLTLYMIQGRHELTQPTNSLLSTEKPSRISRRGEYLLLTVLTICALLATQGGYTRVESILLALVANLLLSRGLTWLDKGFGDQPDWETTLRSTESRLEDHCSASALRYATQRDVAMVFSVATLLLSCFLEVPFFFPYRIPLFNGDESPSESRDWSKRLVAVQTLDTCLAVVSNVIMVICSTASISSFRSMGLSLLMTMAAILARLHPGFSFASLAAFPFAIQFANTSIHLHRRIYSREDTSSWKTKSHLIKGALRLGGMILLTWIIHQYVRPHIDWLPKTTAAETGFAGDFFGNFNAPADFTPDNDSTVHPIQKLASSANLYFGKLLRQQSQTLPEAVHEYRRRYGIPPPPKFDVWFEFAKNRHVRLIDEFDNIHDTLAPFWSLEPQLIRRRTMEILGFENSLLGILIRDGRISHLERNEEISPDWQEGSLVKMIEAFVEHLPDMDLAFNLHDEPRVVMPHDMLSKIVQIAKDEKMPEANSFSNHRNSFSPKTRDISAPKYVAEVRSTRFNKFSRQHTWSHSRIACAPDSPARGFDDTIHDNVTSYAVGPLGFVSNTTAFTDICESPSLQSTFGFFDRPNVFNVIQDLVPVFSQSKISTFQDILYPSPWYWNNKVEYNTRNDIPWEDKNSTLYWRGSTTGGFSRKGGWRRQHRQRVVDGLNTAKTSSVLERNDSSSEWQIREIPQRDLSKFVDVAFSHVGQCDPADCTAQKEYFHVLNSDDQSHAWGSKLLLDMDGNAFSGRFVAFLRSKSAVVKMAVFREWHNEWVRPWVHYIPISLKGSEWMEIVRWFLGDEPAGQAMAKDMAEQSAQWAAQALRREDMEVWFFRLLLEYGRLIDDDRARIGFVGH